MVQLKFRSTVATVSKNKSDTSLVDSGGTHHFFHSKTFFRKYEVMYKTNVQSATETSIIAGKGQVFLPIYGGVYVEAYHTPHFAENVLSVSFLSRMFDLLFSSYGSIHDHVTYYFKQKGTTRISDTIQEEDSLFGLNVSPSGSLPVAGDGQYSPGNDNDCHICMAATRTYVPLLHDNEALNWNYRTGHSSAERYMRLSRTFPSVPSFTRNILRNQLCIPCTLALSRLSPVLRTYAELTHPLEFIHVDITGPIITSIGGSIYSVSILAGYSGKYDAYFIKDKAELTRSIPEYKAKSELHKLKFIRLDGAGDNRSEELKKFCRTHGISPEYSPPYASQRNGAAERLNQEFWGRTLVLLLALRLPDNLWAEAVNHASWICNRFPSDRIDGAIPIQLWKPTT